MGGRRDEFTFHAVDLPLPGHIPQHNDHPRFHFFLAQHQGGSRLSGSDLLFAVVIQLQVDGTGGDPVAQDGRKMLMKSRCLDRGLDGFLEKFLQL